MLSSLLQCTVCGAPVRGSAGLSLCASCALRSAIDLSTNDQSPRPQNVVRLGDYELLDEIARGGMGVVYRARQRSLGRIVALKVLLGGAFAGPDGKRRLHAEAAAAARLQHPGIVAVHEAGELDGQPFFSMDFIAGRTLAEVVRDGPLSGTRAARYLAGIAEAVHYAHTQGVLHRDLKPSNVLVDEFDQPRVTDFGLAKHFSGVSGAQNQDFAVQTQTGQILGSPAYMAPEQATGKAADIGPASDVYALGSIFYELLSGRPPFQGETPHTVIEQVKHVDPVPLRKLNASVPLDLETICLKCLEKQPSRRYASAREFAEDLQRFLRHEPVCARPIGSFGRAWRWARRHPVPAALSFLSASLLIAVALVASISAARIRVSRDEARARLADSFLSEARALRIAGEPGYRAASLTQIRQAGELDHSGRLRFQLRKEAIAALARSDVRRVPVTNLPPCHDLMWMCLDYQFARCALWSQPEKAVLVFQVSDGKRLQTIRAARPDEVVTFSPDGRFLVLRFRSAIEVWNIETGAVALPKEGSDGGGGFTSGAFSADSQFFARAEKGGRIAVYEVRSDQLNKLTDWPLPATARVGSLAWSPNAKAIAFTDDSNHLRVCDAYSGQIRWETTNRAGTYWGLAWNGPYELVAAQAQSDALMLLRSSDGVTVNRINTPNDASARTAFSPDGSWLATSTERFGTRLFQATTGRMVTADSAPSWHLHFDASGRRLGTLFENSRPAYLELLPAPAMQSLPAVSSGDNQVLSFSADGRILLSLSFEGPILWDVTNHRRLVTAKVPNAPYAIFDSAGDTLIASSGASVFRINLAALLNGDTNGAMPVKIASGTGFWGLASNRKRPLNAFADHKGNLIQIFDQQHRHMRTLGAAELPANVEFSPDGRWLSAAAGSVIYIWDTDALDATPTRLPGEEPSPRFSPDSRWLLPLGRQPRLWKTGSWEPGPPLPIHPNNTSGASAAFSPDGRWLVVTQHDREAHLIDFRTLQTAAILEGPGEGRIVDVAFSPDGQILAVARDRGEVQLWDLPTLRGELAKLQLDW